MRRIGRLLAVAVIGGGLLLGVAAPAGAENRSWDGRCQSWEVCLYYYTNFGGYIYDTAFDDGNYSIRHFVGVTAPLNDNTMSLRNNAWYAPVSICKHAWWGGPCLKTNAGYSRATLDDLNNQGSSHIFHYAG